MRMDRPAVPSLCLAALAVSLMVGGCDDAAEAEKPTGPTTCEAAETRCDGLDDDCNGQVDEGLSRACAAGEGDGMEWCVDGAWRGCVVPGGEEFPCDGVDNDGDGEVDEGSQIGEPCVGFGSCGPGLLECAPSGFVVCSSMPGGSEHAAQEEVCDGKDNDCDGLTDEGGLPVGECSGSAGVCCLRVGFYECGPEGALRCSVDPGGSASPAASEVCDGIDNDCDGQTDEGFDVGSACTAPGICGEGVLECAGPESTQCSTGPLGSVDRSLPERCNLLDDDCDGEVDDVPGLGHVCTGGSGACAVEGQLECGDAGLVCSVAPGGSDARVEEEICDGIDNDCDGQVDEGLVRACEVLGEEGSERCEAGEWLRCVPLDADTERACDGIDNDGDDLVDEGFDVGAPCEAPGDCGLGVFECATDLSVRCSTAPGGSADGSSPEVCDARDNDCDSATDEGVLLHIFADRDGDGHGDGEDARRACTPGPDTTLLGDDCDDEEASVFPGGLELCDELDNDCDGLTDEDEACFVPGAANLDPPSQTVYIVAPWRRRQGGAACAIWPEQEREPRFLEAIYSAGIVALLVERATDGALFYQGYCNLPFQGIHSLSPELEEDPVLTPPCGREVRWGFGFDGQGTLHYCCDDTIRRFPNGEVAAHRPGRAPVLLSVLDDGRMLLREAQELVVLGPDGRERSRYTPGEHFEGSLVVVDGATTRSGNRAYVLLQRELALPDVPPTHELISLRLGEDDSWARQRIVPVDASADTEAEMVTLADGTIVICERDPNAPVTYTRVRALLPNGEEEHVWRDVDDLDLETWGFCKLFAGERRP